MAAYFGLTILNDFVEMKCERNFLSKDLEEKWNLLS